MAIVLAVVSCAPAAPRPAPPSTPPTSAPLAASFATPLDAYVSAFGHHWGEASAFNGYVAVAREGSVIFAKAYGQADRATGSAADADTVFRIGSISKTFTALAILQLEEKGLLRIDDPVRKYLPELPSMADPVTIHHCLTHTSGLPNLPDGSQLVAETGAVHPAAEGFAAYKGEALKFRPGERFEYSNAGFAVLAAIVERVSGQSYEAYMQEHVFGPAGMAHTTTVNSPPPPHLAVGYTVDERDHVTVAAPITYVTFGCGAVLSTANDLIAWDRALDGTSLLTEASKQRMFTAEKDVGGIVSTPSRYALGWFVQHDAGHEVLWHGGAVNGFQSSFARIPDAKVTVVVLSNHFGDYGVVDKVAEAALELALTGKGPTPEDEPVVDRFDTAQLSTLVGEYRIDAATRAALLAKFPPDVVDRWRGLSLIAEGDHLFMNWVGEAGPEIFRSTDGSLFTKQDGFSVVTEAGASGGSSALVLTKTHGGGVDMRYVRLATARDSASQPSTCPPGMAQVTGGVLPGEPAVTFAPFCIDTTEVTVAAYTRCVRSGACRPAPTTVAWEGITAADRAKWSPACNGSRRDRQNHPATCVAWTQATAYCRAQGKRLPTEQEWEWASGGGEDGRTYPWGFRPPVGEICWSGVETREGTCAVGTFPKGDAVWGVHDMAGNVGEWTSTTTEGNGHVMKGGGWNLGDAAMFRVVARDIGDSMFRGPNVGIRCVRFRRPPSRSAPPTPAARAPAIERAQSMEPPPRAGPR
jgi:CubicO group peptidase (beta-lactamase class C family)